MILLCVYKMIPMIDIPPLMIALHYQVLPNSIWQVVVGEGGVTLDDTIVCA